MTNSTPKAPDPAFVTLAEAAKRANRSYAWARDRAVVGRLHVRKFAGSRAMYVTVESLEEVLAAESRTAEPSRKRMPKGAHLRLVWSNPDKS